MTLNIIQTLERVPYKEAYERQKELHAQRVAGEIPDTLWLLEHPPVLTTGIRRDQSANILIDPNTVGAEIVETNRGGEVTYHGPGQLVGYLFINIENHGYKVRRFVEKLEGAFISYLHDFHGIEARHDDEHTGVWVGMEKITAIGIALRKRVTLHGFAFNINTNLSHFNWIVPCGITDGGRGVTSLEKLTGHPADFEVVSRDIASELRRALGYEEGGSE
ncbi:MAG: lipoyl(octanoyl) transferase LipB [Spirochaetaceae bacterium]|nr:lipoyl(octanoyl) transferase LipB [Spirochaetaceae bacterium]